MFMVQANRFNLIFISPHNWFEHVSKNKMNRPLKLAEQFSKDSYFEKIMIVSRVHPKLIYSDSPRTTISKGLGYRLSQCNVSKCTYYLEHCLPFGKIEQSILPRIIQTCEKKLEFKRSIMLIADPKSVGLVKFSTHLTLFDAYDDWTLSPLYTNRPKHLKAINKGYKEAEELSDIIFVNTLQMKEKFETKNNKNNVYLLNNTSSLNLEIDVSRPLKGKYTGKVVGYLGNIHERIDLSLLEEMLTFFPDVTFLFIGVNEFSDDKFERLLNNYKNIEHIPGIPYSDVASYINDFDVCIVPHIISPYTLSQDSMKMYDYLSLGKPIVTTPIPPSDVVGSLVYVAENANSFKQQLERALSEEGNELKENRINYMKNNSWNSRTSLIYEIIEKAGVK
ncbi:hypothetical protein BK126_07890 [Paenibacillus sp. FSL H7-0326]|nr:hypothetical protein BK126_07890 [Paenibacillus sp. FSL H7-0326]